MECYAQNEDIEHFQVVFFRHAFERSVLVLYVCSYYQVGTEHSVSSTFMRTRAALLSAL